MKEKLLLIDADQVVYKHTSAHEYEHVLKGDEFTDAWMFENQTALLTDHTQALRDIRSSIDTLSRGYDRAILCFTSTPNFRHDVLPTYKGGRVKKRKPLAYWNIVQELCSEPDATKKYPGLEADDVMSIIATHPKYLNKYDITIYSADKDMLQVPHTNIIRANGVSCRESLEDANHWRYTQALTGDATDGYTGLKGYGPAKAKRYLDSVYGADEPTYVDHVVSAYMDAGESPAQAYQQIDCACILRYSEYNFTTREPILLGDRIND